MRLLIPSAKLVNEELQTIGKLPAIVYPINKNIVFDYLVKQYGEICDVIDVICYEKAEIVHRRLESYKKNCINIVDLPQLGDLGHSIWYGLEDLHTPVIINFADTIVMDNIFETKNDAFFYAVDYRSEIWTFFRMEQNILTEIYDKSAAEGISDQQEKLFVGVFQICDSADLKRCLEKAFENPKEDISSFYYALQMYSRIHPMDAIPANSWFDIGHIDRYYNSKLEVKAREFNHITIDKDRGILSKSSDDKDKFIGEIKWYLKLPADIEYVRPRIFDYSTSYTNPYIMMEYYAYHTVHELYLYGDLSYHQWLDIFKRIRFLCNDFKRYVVNDENVRYSLEDMYLTKTLQRFEQLKKDVRFHAFFGNAIIVNGKKYKSLNSIIEILKIEIPRILYHVTQFNIIHGDLCFANMMVDSNFSFIKVIDPRGKFGSYDIYGDGRYELAKLFHSLDGKYDFIIKDLYTAEYDLDVPMINYQISDRKREYDLFSLFLDVFKNEIGDHLNEIELIEALLFLSMIPLHGENLSHQITMLGTGLDILNRVINILW